jgi:ABC-type sugar transport system substrate-binding protein
MSIRSHAAVLALAAAAALAGCGGDDDSNSSDGSDVCDGLPPLEEKDTYTIGFAQLYEANGPWRDANTKSMVDEADARGYEMVFDPGTKSDPQEQVERMDALIEAQVDAIFIAPHDETTLAPSVVAARRACIPVFVVDRGLDESIAVPGEDYVAYLGSDFRREGEQVAEWMLDNIDGDLNVIELEGTIGSSPGVLRKQGFDERVADESRVTILHSESADFDEDLGYEATLRLVEDYPEANVIYSHNDGMSFGVITALEELGLVPGEDIHVLSIDGTTKATEYIISGEIDVVVECNPKFGPIAYDTMESYARGEDVPLRVFNVDRVFDASNAEEYLPEAF